MARKPITLELSGGKSQRQRIWTLIREFASREADFCREDVTPGDVPNETAREYLSVLTLAGILGCTQIGRAPRVKSRWKLLRDVGAEAPRINKKGEIVTQGNINEAMWGAMQALSSFTPRVLATMSGATENTAKTYCQMLCHAGYLSLERMGKGKGRGGIATTYRLLRSKITGPRPPMITKLKAVYDPNTHAIVWQQGPDEALEATE